MVRKQRLKSLDSLRGMAAATVVIAHACGKLITGHSFDEFTPLYLFRAAHESVIFFFILSGFVLTYQIQSQASFNYRNFIVQRFFRIYIPYLVIIIFSFFLFAIFHTSQDKGLVWSTPLNFDNVMDHLILINNFNTNEYNPVIWSLVHEMRVSLFFPLLLFIITLNWKKVVYCSLLSSLTAGICNVYNINPSLGYNNSYLYTIHYFSLFILGGLIVVHLTELKDWHSRLSKKRRLIILLCALLVIAYSRMFFLIPHKLKFFKIALFNEFVADWVTALCVGYFIVSTSQITNKENWLLRPLLLTLGKISYSLYLIHVPIMLVCFKLFFKTNNTVIMLASIAIALAFSVLANKYVERPSAAIGKKFGR